MHARVSCDAVQLLPGAFYLLGENIYLPAYLMSLVTAGQGQPICKFDMQIYRHFVIFINK